MRRPRSQPLRRGFTLVEAICAMTIIVALGSVASGLIYTGVGGYRSAATTAQLHEEASSALDVIARALRQVPQATGGGGPNVSAVTPSSITFGTSSFSLSGSTLSWVDSGAAAATLLTDVSDFSIQCYNDKGEDLATSLSGSACQPIRRVQVSITLSRGGLSDTIRTRVFIRSMMQGAVP
jgi:prepilin-type N-terminal cleavage/methylation domain-containing protein